MFSYFHKKRHPRTCDVLQIPFQLNPLRNNLYFIVTPVIVAHKSTFTLNLPSIPKDLNYDGSSMNPNVNSSYMRKTFDHADCGAMYTNQAMEMTQTLGDTNKPCTPLQMSVFIWGFACSWWKAKSNITRAKRCGKIQPTRLDIPSATVLQ